MKRQESEAGWTLSIAPWTLLPAVVHRDHLYPATFEATWTRDDGLEVVVGVRVDRHVGPFAETVTVRGLDGGVAGAMRVLPVPAMTKQAAAQLAFEASVDEKRGTISARLITEARPIPMGAPGSRAKAAEKPEKLKRVSELYAEAIRSDVPVGQHVAESLVISKQHAFNLIAEARAKELIPPSRGRGAKVSPEELEAWERKQQRKGRR